MGRRRETTRVRNPLEGNPSAIRFARAPIAFALRSQVNIFLISAAMSPAGRN